jgi:hypothetical protein
MTVSNSARLPARLRGGAAPARRALATRAPASRTAARQPRALRATVCRASGLLAEPWDAAPRSWRSFWAVRLAAAVVESNQDRQTVTVQRVESPGLEWPPSAQEAQRRVRTNSVLYRQNYAVVALACLAFGALRHPLLLAGLAAALAAAAAASDRLLGEAALALDGQLAWNAKRVAGVDRALLQSVAPCVAFLCVAAAPQTSVRWLFGSSCAALCLALAHAALRPVDLEAVASSFWGDLTAAKNRCVRYANARITRLLSHS